MDRGNEETVTSEDRSDLKAANITVGILTYIPFLKGFYRFGLDVLKLSLWSLFENTKVPYQLMIFDNGSCPEVIGYLRDLQREGKIEKLFLSDKNIGKVGAWNVIFGASTSEYVAYADSDVYYQPHWLEKQIEIMETYPKVGTVTGQPRRRRSTFSESSYELVKEIPGADVQIGKYIPEAWIYEHVRSLGKLETLESELARDDYRISLHGVTSFITAQHYQFVIRKDVIHQFLPFPFDGPMGADVAQLDHAIDDASLLRLATEDRLVLHIGNHLDREFLDQLGLNLEKLPIEASLRDEGQSGSRLLLDFPPVRKLLLGIYGAIFRLYYESRIY